MLINRFLFVLFFAAGPAFAGPEGRVHVIDGDTFDVGETRVRIHGIDAPETKQTCATEQGVTWGCGAWVNTQVALMYEGKQARCEAVDTDRYGRVVARCFVDGADVGEALVSGGLAYAYRKYSWDYDLAEKQAAVSDRGLHAMRVQTPAQYRKTRVKGRIPQGKCRIKGNISRKGVHIYHMPGQEHYERTGINESKGEQWFCSEAEAVQAGWRRARR